MGEKRNACRVWWERQAGRKRSLGRLRCKWEDNIKMGLREIWWVGREWICLAWDRDSGWVL
jgi:hypothetical protein